MLSINTCLDTSYPVSAVAKSALRPKFTRNVVYISYEELTRPVKKSSIGTGNMMRNVAVERSKGNNSSMATADKSAHEPVYGKKSLPPLPKTTLSISANRQFALSKPNKSTATTTPASTIRMIVASQPKTPKQYYSTALKNKTYDATSITRSSRFGPANLMVSSSHKLHHLPVTSSSPAQLKNGNVAPTLSRSPPASPMIRNSTAPTTTKPPSSSLTTPRDVIGIIAASYTKVPTRCKTVVRPNSSKVTSLVTRHPTTPTKATTKTLSASSKPRTSSSQNMTTRDIVGIIADSYSKSAARPCSPSPETPTLNNRNRASSLHRSLPSKSFSPPATHNMTTRDIAGIIAASYTKAQTLSHAPPIPSPLTNPMTTRDVIGFIASKVPESSSCQTQAPRKVVCFNATQTGSISSQVLKTTDDKSVISKTTHINSSSRNSSARSRDIKIQRNKLTSPPSPQKPSRCPTHSTSALPSVKAAIHASRQTLPTPENNMTTYEVVSMIARNMLNKAVAPASAVRGRKMVDAGHVSIAAAREGEILAV